MNRIQTESIISDCKDNSTHWKCDIVFKETVENGWLEIESPPIYNKRREVLQILASHQSTDNMHWRHIAKVNKNTGEKTFLTEGNFTVTSILAWWRNNIYFMATTKERPGIRHLYRMKDNGMMEKDCVTCKLRTNRGDRCLRNSVEFNPDTSHYVHTCEGPGIPESVLRKTSDSSIVFVLEDNRDLDRKLKAQDKLLPKLNYTRYDLEGGFSAFVKIQFPPNMKDGVTYPVLVHVDASPGSQLVTDSWAVGWPEYLVTSRNVIYVSIDGRGSGFQSNQHLFQVKFDISSTQCKSWCRFTRVSGLSRFRIRFLSLGSSFRITTTWILRGSLSGAGATGGLPLLWR